MIAVVREHVERVEVVGLDEAYLDLSDLEQPEIAARRIKAAVRERTGLGGSIGLGPSKLVAKVASDADKPDGFVRLSIEEARNRFADRPPGLLPGIGPKIAARLAEHGIATLGALAAAPPEDLTAWFGPRHGHALARLARFEDDRPLELAREPKSESRETTFPADVHGVEALLGPLAKLTHELCERLADQGRAGRTIGIKVRLDDFSTHTRAATLAAPTNAEAGVGTVAAGLLRRFDPQRPVRLLGVRVAGLERCAAASSEGRSDGLARGDSQLELSV